MWDVQAGKGCETLDAEVLPMKQYECGNRECGAVFNYDRQCLGEHVAPSFCPQCGTAILATLDTPELLRSAAEAQTAFWDALRVLEIRLGFAVDGTRDLCETSIEDLTARPGAPV